MEAKLPKWAASLTAGKLPHAVIRRPLRRQGSNEMSPLQWPGPVGVAVIEPRSLGMFEFTDIGKRVFVQPVLCGPQFSDLVDIIAWNPRDPSRIWTRTLSGVPLGVDRLDRAEIEGTHILPHPSLRDWLRGGGEGAYITDRIATATKLRNLPTIITEDAEFGTEVRRRPTQPLPSCSEIRVIRRAAA